MITSPSAVDTQQVADHYNSLDTFYRDIWGEHVHHGYWEHGDETHQEAILHLSHVLIDWLDLKSGDKVCDLGCGYGGTSRLLANQHEAKVTGFTLSERQREFAESIAVTQGEVRYHCQDFMQNTLEDASFDAMISIECLEHIQDKQAVFDEAYRILKPGARMSLALWTACDAPNRLQKSKLEDICKEGRMPSLHSAFEYETHITEAGFQLLKKQDISKKVSKTWSICAQHLIHRLLTKSDYRTFVLNGSAKDRVFALTLFRILAAYRTRTMLYMIYSIEKPALQK